jgi:hypothetical protein
MRWRTLPVLILARIMAFVVMVGLGMGQAQAQGARPGSEIVNTAVITWGAGTAAQTLTAEARFTVVRPRSNGILTAWELDKGQSPGPFRDIVFAQGDYRVNPWIPLPEPVDSSTLTGDPAPISRGAPLRVFKADRIRLGVPVFFTLEDAGLNFDPAAIETVEVTLTDAATGDVERLRFYETGPNTGEFSAWINTTESVAVPSNGVMATRALSVISAQYNDATNQLNNLEVAVDVGPIDPFGVLFDSSTGERVNGVEVMLINVATGLPAQVFGDDMIATYPSSVVTGSRVTDSSGRVYQMEPGGFRFPFVMPGIYRLQIVSSVDYVAPSSVDDVELRILPGGPYSVTTGSRLEVFPVTRGPALRIDVPLDPLDIAQITREASHAEAGIGEFLEFTVTVTISERRTLTIVDTLPDALSFLPGTLQINGQPATPQLSADGRTMTYDLPMVPIGRPIIITYGAQVLPPATAGQALVSRSTIDTSGLRRLSADHRLSIRDTMGLDQVAILGQVSAHLSTAGCGAPVDPEAPIDLSGIRILLENGEYAITDSDGRFTFRDIYRRPRVVQMDVTTLPEGARPVSCFAGTRSAGSAISQFVELRQGMMGRVEFYLEFPPETETDRPTEAGTAPDTALARPRSPLEIYDLAWLDGKGAGHGIGFVAPADAHLPRSEAIDIVLLRPTGAKSEVTVNGEPVPGLRSEPLIRSSNGKLELVRFRAVRVGEGRNALDLVITAADGRILREQSHQVLYGVRPTRVELIRSASQLDSDGRTQPQVVLRLTDAAGIPIRPGMQVSVVAQAPFGFAPDGPVRRSSPASERGPRSRTTATVQDDGLITLDMAATLEGGTAELSIPLTGRDLTVRVPISVAQRPWVLVGLAEGTLAHDTVRQHMRRDGEIGNALSGRVSLFAEGVIRGSWLLSLRYDTAQDDEAFYGIDPDADYIVYGDASTQGNAAQSRFPLYLRLRREGAEFLVGDFNTGLTEGGVEISQKVTGVRAVFEDENWRVMAFAAQTTNTQVEDRIPLNGTVGPYQLSQTGIVPHSPTVRVVTVSRADSSEELGSVTLQAGRDYVVSTATGRLFLRRAIPAFTPDLQRQVLVIDYEVDREMRDSMIAGIRAEAQVTQRLRVGATGVHATRVEGRDLSITLAGVDLRYEVNDALTLSAETLFAQRRFASTSDTGLRSELRAEFERDTTSIAAYLRQQRGHVALTASDRRIDTTVAGMTLRHQVWADPADPEQTWAIEGLLLAEDDRAGEIRKGDTEILLTRTQSHRSQSIGLRSLIHDTVTGNERDLRLVYRATGLSEDGRLTQSFGIEGSLRGDAPLAGDQVTLGIDYALNERISLFGTLEIEKLRATGIEARRMTFGAEFTPMEGRSYRSALSWAGADSGNVGGQAFFIGGDHAYDLGEGLTASLGADVQWDMGAADMEIGQTTRQPFGESIGNPYIAESFSTLRGGLRYETETWGAGVDAESRLTRSEVTHNLRLRMDGEISETWSAGGEVFWGGTRPDGRARKDDLELRISAAHRAGPRDPITLLQSELRQSDTGGVESLTAIGSVYRSQYLSDVDFLNLRYGVKYTSANLRTGKVDDVLNLIGTEYRRDLTEILDAGLHGSALYAARSGRLATSFGLSVGVTPFDNGWLSIGYNLTGFEDEDFSQLGHTDKGAFIQFRMKFDADSLRGMFK